MPMFVLNHRHGGEECRAAFAAWNGFDSPLREHGALASCAFGGHGIHWTVIAGDETEALSMLPPFVASRTEVNKVEEVQIP